MPSIFYVALGGALGASARHLVGQAVDRAHGGSFPMGTMSVNILGSFLMGLMIGWLALRVSGGETWRLFLGVGLLGGFTTFSAFSLDAIVLYERKAYGALMSYVGLSVSVSIAALFLGLILMRKLVAS